VVPSDSSLFSPSFLLLSIALLGRRDPLSSGRQEPTSPNTTMSAVTTVRARCWNCGIARSRSLTPDCEYGDATARRRLATPCRDDGSQNDLAHDCFLVLLKTAEAMGFRAVVPRM
jgi:hypothetical protein